METQALTAERPVTSRLASTDMRAAGEGGVPSIIDPADIHCYRPGWTMVRADMFNAATTARTMSSVLPRGVHWIKSAVASFEPERDAVILDGCRVVKYKQLVVCPGLKLDWHGGVADDMPAPMEYVKAHGIGLNFGQTLVSVDGPARKATFVKANADGTKETIAREFDMIHAVPPQKAPDFICVSPLSDAAGWIDVAPGTLLSCPLTVERGKIVLAECTYGGKVALSFPKRFIDGTRSSAMAWYLKERVLPPSYWKGMLKGREWLAQSEMTT